MTFSYKDKALALAGIFQACRLVQQVARKNMADNVALEASLASVFNLDADTTEAVYGGVEGVRPGLKILQEQLEKSSEPRDIELTRYVIGVMHLERQLAGQPEMLERIQEGIASAQQKREALAITHPEVIAQLAKVYSDTVSTLTPRIIVQGEEGYLSNPETANKVRALLLAAMRSAVLWRQVGGRRWQLLFVRSALVREVAAMLQR
ncbi:MAG: high frequency lysogenization protein HflD [Gammaproteobacteria bacterium]|nr:high frequency lysogenization protein HflD [Gammaproteobacteria bacterium]